MRLDCLTLAAVLMAGPASAQTLAPSSVQNSQSASEDAPALNLPVSIDNIRDALSKPPVLQGMDRKPDFTITVEEQQRLEELFHALEFKMGPPPPGGLYAYEQQRLLFNPTNAPLAQPYAAFSGPQLITLAIENLIGRYVIGRVSGAQRNRAEKVARAEVKRAIAEFCAKQPDRSRIEICWMGTDR
jgi:hypothetical protein